MKNKQYTNIPRVNLILNGIHELRKVANNLKKIICSEDVLLLYTFESEDVVKNVLKDEIGYSDEYIAENMYYNIFNKYKASDFTIFKRIIVLKIPNNKFKTKSAAFNSMFRFCDDIIHAKYLHVFCDDIKIAEDDYSPLNYEEFMELFDENIYLDAKTNTGNYIFKQLVPRFIFVTKLLKSPICFYQYEGRDHFILNRDKIKIYFDEKIKHIYLVEFLIRLKKSNLIKHLTFFPDPFIKNTIIRDSSLPYSIKSPSIKEEYINDEVYIRDTLKEFIQPENDTNIIIKECMDIIEQKFKKETNND